LTPRYIYSDGILIQDKINGLRLPYDKVKGIATSTEEGDKPVDFAKLRKEIIKFGKDLLSNPFFTMGMPDGATYQRAAGLIYGLVLVSHNLPHFIYIIDSSRLCRLLLSLSTSRNSVLLTQTSWTLI
jgi:hypothetical protein